MSEFTQPRIIILNLRRRNHLTPGTLSLTPKKPNMSLSSAVLLVNGPFLSHQCNSQEKKKVLILIFPFFLGLINHQFLSLASNRNGLNFTFLGHADISVCLWSIWWVLSWESESCVVERRKRGGWRASSLNFQWYLSDELMLTFHLIDFFFPPVVTPQQLDVHNWLRETDAMRSCKWKIRSVSFI